MEGLVTILLQFILGSSCKIPQVEVHCEQKRIEERRNMIVEDCTSSYEGNDYRIIVDQDRIMELWQDGKRSFLVHDAQMVWRNIYYGKITGREKAPYCSVKKLTY
jgi:hypothetical protein